ncbi:unnamed protein product [Nesidiocoris tenuis]|uniref:Uncharacterized protein n=1 Tax=Nesidiocoris tenuis TaxID=355587 RepID=A0A6H5GLR1_9HEMI|nr:unnamed protein product [Nesidiocoris tenuis]
MDLSHLATERLNYYTVHQCKGESRVRVCVDSVFRDSSAAIRNRDQKPCFSSQIADHRRLVLVRNPRQMSGSATPGRRNSPERDGLSGGMHCGTGPSCSSFGSWA